MRCNFAKSSRMKRIISHKDVAPESSSRCRENEILRRRPFLVSRKLLWVNDRWFTKRGSIPSVRNERHCVVGTMDSPLSSSRWLDFLSLVAVLAVACVVSRIILRNYNAAIFDRNVQKYSDSYVKTAQGEKSLNRDFIFDLVWLFGRK